MSEGLRPTPTDAVGMPLPIAPQLDRVPDAENWHHAYHPKAHPIFETVGGWALRNSRVQLVDERLHNNARSGAYHQIYEGPPIPKDEATQFRLCVLACAGYMPEEGLDFSYGEPKRVRLTEAQRDHFRLRASPEPFDDRHVFKLQAREGLWHMSFDEVCKVAEERALRQANLTYRNLTYRYEPVRAFFEDYAARQPLSEVKNRDIDEFLHTADEERRLYLGHFLIAKAVEEAVGVVQEDYQQARKLRLLHPSMPDTPQTLVKHKLGRVGWVRESTFPRLRQQLLAA